MIQIQIKTSGIQIKEKSGVSLDTVWLQFGAPA